MVCAIIEHRKKTLIISIIPVTKPGERRGRKKNKSEEMLQGVCKVITGACEYASI